MSAPAAGTASPSLPMQILPRVQKQYAMGEQYVAQWFKETLQKAESSAFDTSRLNGASNNRAIMDAVDSVLVNKTQGGLEGAQIAWFNAIAPTIPQIAEIVNKPKVLYRLDELESLPSMQWLFEREIPKQGLSLLYGLPGSGKSFMALHFAMRLALQQKNVVYVAGEGKTGYKNRTDAWIKHHVAENSQRPENLYFWFEAVPLLNQFQTDCFINDVQFIRPSLIIFDTLATMMEGGDENSSHDMGIVTGVCRRMQETLNTAVLLVHHTTKTGGSSRGSSALPGAADVMMEMADFDDTIRLRNTKIKDEEAPKDKLFVLKKVPLEQNKSSAVILPATGINSSLDELKGAQRKVLEWLASPVFDGGASTSDLRNATDLPWSTFFYACKKLIQRGMISRPAQARYVITEEGTKLAKFHGIDQ